MDKSQLIKTANQLKIVSDKASSEYKQKSEQLINNMNTLMLKRLDIENLIGSNNTDMMKDNHSNHVLFIASILKNHNPDILVETILWVFRAYRSRGFHTNYWAAQLNTWRTILKETLTTESFNEISILYEWMIINIPTFVQLSDEDLEASISLH